MSENKSKQITIEQVKKLLSKNKNTSEKIEIIQWPIWCMLGLVLFDQSPETQQIEVLPFRLKLVIEDITLALVYWLKIYKDHIIDVKDDIVVKGKIVKTQWDLESPIWEEKFRFLAENTEVNITYNQDSWTWNIEILK